MRTQGRKRPSKTRVVLYDYEGDFDESEVERILERAVSKGVVTLFDTGRGHIVWFEGPPGPELRKVRNQVRQILTKPSGSDSS